MISDGGEIKAFEDASFTADNTQPVVTIPKDTLDSDSKYLFTLTYSKGTRSATSEIEVEVVPGSPPSVIIEPFLGQHNAKKALQLKAYVTSTLAFEAAWMPVDGEGNTKNITKTLLELLVLSSYQFT